MRSGLFQKNAMEANEISKISLLGQSFFVLDKICNVFYCFLAFTHTTMSLIPDLLLIYFDFFFINHFVKRCLKIPEMRQSFLRNAMKFQLSLDINSERVSLFQRFSYKNVNY